MNEQTQVFNIREQEELRKEILEHLRDTFLALEQWKRDSLASQIRY